MKKIISILKIDLRLVFRDKIVLYMALGPVLLAMVMLAVMGGAGNVAMTYAVLPNVPQAVLRNLGELADVRVYECYDELLARVERADSAAGVIMKDGRPVLMLEGNEPEEFKKNSALLLKRAAAGDLPVFDSHPVHSKGSVAAEIAFVMLLLLSIFLGGAVAGFNMVSERESRAIKALAVSPVTLNGYLLARTALAFMLSMANVALCSVILGKGGQLPQLLLATLASVPMCGLIAVTLGATSDNQMAATATIKLLLPACLIVPISSVFVPEGFRFLYWWIPMYWQYQVLAGGLAGKADLSALAYAFLAGMAWFSIFVKSTAQKLGLRYNKGGM